MPDGDRTAPLVLRTVPDLRIWREELRRKKKTLAFIPTMGALHDGHLALARQGLREADSALVSIFVNPAQFAPHEDLDTYPRTWDPDIEKLAAAGVPAVWAPSVTEMYPEGFATSLQVSGVSAMLEGEFRPHFFGGVALVVAKLLLQVLPEIAIFGEKDYQQLLVVRRMARDLDIPVEIRGAPVVRDRNGLALSSRNAYLSAAEYKVAVNLNRILFAMAEKIGRSAESAAALQAWGKATLTEAGFEKIDYLEIRNAATLLPFSGGDGAPLRILAAAWLGKTRLIDNVAAGAVL